MTQKNISHAPKVGFIGLGLMGEPMAKNVLSSGFPLTVYNRTAAKTRTLQSLGAAVATTPEEVADKSDIIITIVTAGEDLHEVLFGDAGVVVGARKGSVVVDMSTIGPTWAKKISRELQNHDIHFVDAPVTGSTPGARDGTLTIFIGGTTEDVEHIRPVLSAMGSSLHHMGPVGSGQAIKLINNHLIAAQIISLAEAMSMADTMGLARKEVVDVLDAAPVCSKTMSLFAQNYASHNYPLRFSIKNMAKDLHLATLERSQKKLNNSLLTQTHKTFSLASKTKFAHRDVSEILAVID